ncbi:apolipoprotein N-acyltransferase [Malonomonas rubra]|uniref:apolipoprotein N-acyltransferase n=1 Tax=Malonomonas rubra TaxID=57040 RepID=UPI0026EA85DD|nr:apolipoprotein N-acyltransferase [Malonomonas rubra]
MPRFDRSLIFSAASGLLLAAAFPRPDVYPLAWVALIPLLLVMKQRPFASGYVCGISYFAAVLYWLNLVMTTYGGLNLVFSLLAYLMLLTYLAVFFGVSSWLACVFEKQFKLPYLLSFPVLWVALEYLRGLLLTGFPWALLGYSQQNFSLAIQSADMTGVYGVSLLLVAVNCAWAWIIQQPRNRYAWLGLVCTLLMSISHFGYGAWRQNQPLDARQEQLNVALIQGNVDQAVKWDPQYRQTTVDKYLRLSAEAAQQKPDLLIWPEAATPFFLQEKIPLAEQVRQVPLRQNSYLLVGSPAYQQLDDGKVDFFNSAYLFSPQGKQLGRSDKIHLVPFGEYVPLGKLLSFINKLVVGVGDFSPGIVKPLSLNGHSLGVLICYEVIFPELARDYVRHGAGLLVNLTNDAWFGHSSAPYQHLAMARFRAIENRIWLARAANTGISAFIAPSGKVTAAGPIFEELYLSGTVGLGSEPTFYTRFGPVMAQVCLLLSVLGAIALAWRQRRGN